MKRWVSLFAFLGLFMIAFAGCSGGGDGSPYSTADSGAEGDAAAEGGGYGVVDSGKPDAASDSGVADASDDGSVIDSGEIDSGVDAGFDAGPPFVVTVAASLNDVTATVTFNEAPDATEATTKTNYAISGLTISGATISGNVVTLTTSVQSATSYTVTVTGVTRASDGATLITNTANFTGRGAFDVSSAASAGSTTVNVTFDAPPDMTSANTAANYSIPGLTVSNALLSGSVVTLTTSTQTAISYSITVSNVTRASDGEVLSNNHATFTGHPTFNLSTAMATSATTVDLTFDAAPNATNAIVIGNYAIAGLTISNASLTGNVVTLTTTAQTATALVVIVSNVTRASDGEPLTTNTANFTGIAPFDVSSASATSLTKVAVTFDAAPDPASAGTATNYSIPGLLVNSVSLSGSVATLTTSTQTATTYALTVFNVTRASDGQPLTTNTASFTQSSGIPTVTSVVVASTSPNNGTTPYNTGTSTLTITGTSFTGVTCLTGVKLDDLNGAGTLVGTTPASCSVDSDTQITAVFSTGIRTNGSTGWNVKVTNANGTNALSSVKFVPVAGLVVSEVYTGTSGNTTHEFLSIYNPTGASIDVGALGLSLHTRSGATTPADVAKTLTKVTTNTIASHGFMLFVSSASNSSDSWYAHRDFTYSATSNGLVANGGVYISLSGTADVNVIDKVGWGSQAAGGYEGTATPDISSNDSIQRIFTGAVPTDSDVNNSDFNAQSTTLAHKGTADAGL